VSLSEKGSGKYHLQELKSMQINTLFTTLSERNHNAQKSIFIRKGFWKISPPRIEKHANQRSFHYFIRKKPQRSYQHPYIYVIRKWF
jgi:hypothetical protein